MNSAINLKIENRCCLIDYVTMDYVLYRYDEEIWRFKYEQGFSCESNFLELLESFINFAKTKLDHYELLDVEHWYFKSFFDAKAEYEIHG